MMPDALAGKSPYVRLGPTTLFKAPECYGAWSAKSPYCLICPIHAPCSANQPIEWREEK